MNVNAYSTLMYWPIFKFQNVDDIQNIRMAFVFGKVGDELLISTSDLKVFGLGTNTAGCLGIGTNKSTKTFVEVKELRGKYIKKFACGSGPHVLALTDDGHVYAWGCNMNGQFGDVTVTQCSIPFLANNITVEGFIVDIACGWNQSLLLTDTGMVYTIPLTGNRMPTHSRRDRTDDYNSMCNKKSTLRWQHIVCNATVRSISCGSTFSMLHTEHTLYTNTRNKPIDAGIDIRGLGITKIICGHSHTLCLTTSGIVLSMGDNSCGQLGIGCISTNPERLERVTFPNQTKIVDIAAVHCNNISIAIDAVNRVFIWGYCRGQLICAPTLCRALSLHEAMVSFAAQSVMHTPLIVSLPACGRISNADELSILESLRLSFNNPETSDLTIEVEGQQLYVHKVILKMRCLYFRTMLKEPWEENGKMVITLDSFPYNVYKEFLYYLYTNEFTLDTPMELCKLFEIADQYCLPELKKRCTYCIKYVLDDTNVLDLYEFVVEKGFEDLEDICMDVIVENMNHIFLLPKFAELPAELIKRCVLKAASNGAFSK